MKVSVGNQKAVTAKRAATLLGIKPATLYAYVSRGLIKPVGKDAARRSLFRISDVEKLRAKSRARSGRGAVAAEALRWGDPVLDSSITRITSAGPVYRGILAIELAENDTPFENVCELLWSGVLPDQELIGNVRNRRWQGDINFPLNGFAGIFLRMMKHVSGIACTSDAPETMDRQFEAARTLIDELALDFAFRFSNGRLHKPDYSLAGLLAVAANKNFAVAKKLINRALIVCADHELTPSTFVTRISASTGANALAAVAAAFGAMSGKLHGAHFGVVKDEIAKLKRLKEVELRRMFKDGELPGCFHHTLYPSGDPRSGPIQQIFSGVPEVSEDFGFMQKICELAKKRGIEAPTIDLALLMLCSFLEISEEFAAVLFGIGRLPGLFAHYQEQCMSGFMVRPRARYNGR